MKKLERKIGFDVYSFEPNAEYNNFTFHRLTRKKGGSWSKQMQITIPIADEDDVIAFLEDVIKEFKAIDNTEEPESGSYEEQEEEDIPW